MGVPISYVWVYMSTSLFSVCVCILPKVLEWVNDLASIVTPARAWI